MKGENFIKAMQNVGCLWGFGTWLQIVESKLGISSSRQESC